MAVFLSFSFAAVLAFVVDDGGPDAGDSGGAPASEVMVDAPGVPEETDLPFAERIKQVKRAMYVRYLCACVFARCVCVYVCVFSCLYDTRSRTDFARAHDVVLLVGGDSAPASLLFGVVAGSCCVLRASFYRHLFLLLPM